MFGGFRKKSYLCKVIREKKKVIVQTPNPLT